MNERIPTNRIPGPGELQFPKPVIDLDDNTEIEFSPVGWFWGPVERYEGRSIFEESFDYTVEEHLFLHPGSSNYWTILTESTHGEFGSMGPAEVQRISDETAARWFVTNGINIPDELNQFRKKLVFQPGPPVVKNESATKANLEVFSPAEQRIVDLLRESGHRMTTMQVIAGLVHKYGDTSGGVTKQHLATLVRRRVLDNNQDVKPKGYGLVAWS